ncbi:hypothetical protein BDZ89DRAFT_1108828 [Hymenopellis radicata]|nr:hypothetical protein BDZ89DRAFT_1108828 [Hymenopellis radicata]
MPPRIPKDLKADLTLSDHFGFPVCESSSNGTTRHYALVRTPTKRTISAFVDSLSHPDGPQHCVQFYISCIYMFTDTEPLFQELRLASPEIFTAMLRFVTYKRSTQAVSALEKKLARCRCPKDDGHWIHALSRSDASLRRLITLISSFLARALIPFAIAEVTWPSLDRIFKDAKKAAKRGERAPWPLKSEDALPNPPQDMLDMLWQHYDMYKDGPLLLVIQLLLGATGTTLTSRLHAVPCWPEQIVSHIDRLLKNAYSDADVHMDFRSLTSILFYAIERFFQNDALLQRAWAPYAHDTVSLMTKALQHERDPSIIRILVRVGKVLLMFCSQNNLPVLSNMPSYSPLILKEFFGDEGPDLHVSAYDKTRRLAQSDLCQAPGCTETFSTQNRKLKTCSGCKTVSYCSRECQVAAWKHAHVPHKPFCPVLAAYNDKIGIDWRKLSTVLGDWKVIRKQSLDAGITPSEAKKLLRFDYELITWKNCRKLGEVDPVEFRTRMGMDTLYLD